MCATFPGLATECYGGVARSAGMTALRRRRLVRRLLAVAAVLVLGVVVLVVGAHVVVAGERARVYRTVAAVPAREVAIVPGALVGGDGRPSMILEDRLQTALELHQAGKVRRILVSGDHARRSYDEVNAMRRWLVDRGVPSDDVFMDHAGLRTLDTMQRAARVFGVRGAIVCTQDFHLARALYLARDAGIDAVGLVADRHAYPQATHDGLRETLATTLAVLEVAFGRGPRFLGPRVDLDGDAAATHDAWTRDLRRSRLTR
jgi:SanA protein